MIAIGLNRGLIATKFNGLGHGLYGGVRRRSFDFKTCLRSNGTADHTVLMSLTNLGSGWTSFTFGLWAKNDSATPGTSSILANFEASNRVKGFGLRYGATGDLTWDVGSGSALARAQVTLSGYNKWKFYGAVFDGSLSTNANRLKVYVGVPGTDSIPILQSPTYSGTIPTSVTNPALAAKLFGDNYGTGGVWTGAIDSVCIWQHANYDDLLWAYGNGYGNWPRKRNLVRYWPLNKEQLVRRARDYALNDDGILNNAFTFAAGDGWEDHYINS